MKARIIKLIESNATTLICLLTLMAVGLSIGIGNLEQEYSQKSWFKDGDPLVTQYEKFKDEYGSDTSLMIVLAFKDNVFLERNLKRIYQITDDLWEIPHFLRIDSLTNYSQTWGEGDEINISPLIRNPSEEPWDEKYLNNKMVSSKDIKQIQNYLISEDQKTVVIYAFLQNRVGQESMTAKNAIKNINNIIIPKYKGSDLNIMITGAASIGHAFEKESLNDLLLILPIALCVLFAILFMFLRNLVATIISLGMIAITLLSVLGLQGWLDIKMGLITGMCPLIIIAICVADLVHIFSKYLEAYQAGSKTPLRDSLNKNIFPTFLTSVTTIIGFLSFLPAKLYPIADMGIVAASGIALAWIYSIFLICPLIHLIPIEPKFMKSREFNFINFNFVHKIVTTRAKSVVLFFGSLTALAIYLSSQNVIDSNMQNYFVKSTDFRVATDFVEKEIGGTNSVELILKSNSSDGVKDPTFLKNVDQLIKNIYKIPDVTKVNSLLSPLKEVHQVLNGGKESEYKIANNSSEIAQELFFLEISLPPEKSINSLSSTDKKDLRVSVLWHKSSSVDVAHGSKQIMALVEQQGLKGHITGLTPLILGLDKYIVTSFVESMLIASFCITIFMMIVFKSVFIGLLSLIPNIIVPTFGAAILYLFGRTLDASSVLIFSICLGIAIDDTIYFLTNFQKAIEEKLSIEDAIQKVLSQAGKTLSYTTFILICVFGLFSIGSFVPNQNFAIATTVVMGSALILDLTFLPSIIVILNKSRFTPKRFLVKIS